jgi:anaerobic dimethyl sulfoxide reductase subunit A
LESKKLSEKKKEESITEKKISRRSMLKWTGALAGGAVIGGAAVYAATYKAPTPPPPPPPSLKPPLSPEIQSRVDQITKDLIDRHTGERLVYGGCQCNCGGTGCFFKYHVKDGVLTAIEPDDTHYPQVGMEDKVMTQKDFDWGLINRRGCPINYSMIDYTYSPERIIYPIKRAPGTPRGGNQWVRTTWDDAMTTIATQMKQLKDKYGPFFLLNPYGGRTAGADQVFTIYGAGTMGFGLCSDDCSRLMQPFMQYQSYNDSQDALKYSKLQILLGMSHYTTRFGGSAYASGWYRRMAREKGIPIIEIDPKYTWDAEIQADQYIPIKAGTDCALMMAMAYVILTEGLYDQTWVDKYMYGFQQQADYILGKGGKGTPDPKGQAPGYLATGFAPDYTEYDKIPKTPEWAEKICAIPAATIRELARLYGKTKPAVFLEHYGVRRKSYGEYGLKMTIFLNILTGNGPAVAGGFCSNGTGVRSMPGLIGSLPASAAIISSVGGSGGGGTYSTPTFYRAFHWWKAISYSLRVLNGGPSVLYPGKKMDWDEWATIVGFNAAPQFLGMFNPKMIWGNASNQVVTGENTNAQIRAMIDPAIEFSFYQHNRVTTSAKYTDMVLPIGCESFEQSNFRSAGYGGFDGQQYMSGFLAYPGETRTTEFNCCTLLEKLGGLDMAHQFWSEYNGAATYWDDMEKSMEKRFEKGRAWLKSKGVANPPTYAELRVADKGHGLTQFHPAEWYGDYNETDNDTWHGQANISKTWPADTQSGKIEVFTPALADNSTRYKEHFDYKGRRYQHMPNDWRDLQPISVYHPCFNGMEDYPKGHVARYPLMIITANSRYQTHYFMRDPGNPRIRDVYRHALTISATDAKARGIKDGDICRVWNDQGSVALPAYVTNRMMPGIVNIRMGMGPNVTLKSFGGLDACIPPTRMGACTNTFTGGDDISPVTPAKVTNSVDVEKMAEGYSPEGVVY